MNLFGSCFLEGGNSYVLGLQLAGDKLISSVPFDLGVDIGSKQLAVLVDVGQELLQVTNQVMPVYFLGMTLFGIQMACQSTFIALGQAKVSLFIALLRKVILLIPLAVILPKKFGVMGIYYAEPTADFTSVTVTAILFVITMRKILKNWKKKEE